MATIEQVEKLRQKANVTYDEAKTALDAANGDMLDAIIYLERAGKIQPPVNDGSYSTKNNDQTEKTEFVSENPDENIDTFRTLLKKLFRWIGKMLRKGNQNTFEVIRGNSTIISLPVTILVFLLIFAFWIVVPLIVIGLFFNCRYYFKGPDLDGTGVNNMMDSAANAAESLKQEIKDKKDENTK